MLNGTLRYCSHIRCFHPVTSLTSNGIVEAATAFGCFRSYSNDKGSCCKDIAQSQGKRVEPWPKPDPPPPAWRLECPREPQPPNYDPYRIKVPDIACPPLPPNTAKEVPGEASNEELKASATNFGSAINPILDLFCNSPVVHPDYWKESQKDLSSPPREIQEPLPRLGYHGKNIYKFAFHEPWKPLDRLTLLSEAEKQENGLTEVSNTEKY